MAGIRITWTDPTTRVDGSPLQAEQIGGIEVSMRVEGAPDYTVLGTVDAGVMQFEQTDLPAGSYSFSLRPFDTQNPPQYGSAVEVSATILLAAPSPVSDAQAVVV